MSSNHLIQFLLILTIMLLLLITIIGFSYTSTIIIILLLTIIGCSYTAVFNHHHQHHHHGYPANCHQSNYHQVGFCHNDEGWEYDTVNYLLAEYFPMAGIELTICFKGNQVKNVKRNPPEHLKNSRSLSRAPKFTLFSSFLFWFQLSDRSVCNCSLKNIYKSFENRDQIFHFNIPFPSSTVILIAVDNIKRIFKVFHF